MCNLPVELCASDLPKYILLKYDMILHCVSVEHIDMNPRRNKMDVFYFQKQNGTYTTSINLLSY